MRHRIRWQAISKSLTIALAAFVICIPSFSLPTATTLSDPINEKLDLVKKLEASPNKAAYADALFDLAIRYNNIGDMKNALDYFQRSLSIERELGKRPEKQYEAQVEVARAMLFLGDKQNGLEAFKQAIEFAKAHNLKDAEIAATGVAVALMQSGNVKGAEDYLREQVATARPKSIGLADLLGNLAALCIQDGRIEEGLRLKQQSVEIVADVGDEGHYGMEWVELANLQEIAGQPVEAMKTLDAVRKRFDPSIFPDVHAHADCCQANNLFNRGQINEAQNLYKRATAAAEKMPEDPRLQIETLIGLGNADCDLEQFADAQKAHKDAVALADKLDDRSLLSKAEVQLANDYLIQGSPERALHLLKKSAERTKVGNPPQYAQVLGSMGRCYTSLGQPQAAEKYYREAINMMAALHDNINRAVTLNSLAVVYLDSGDYAKFDRTYAEASALYDSLPKRDQARFDYNAAQSKVMRRQYPEAIALYQTALKKADDTGDEGLESGILRGLGVASYFSGQYEQGLGYYKKALAMTQNSGAIEAQWDCNLGLGKCYKALNQPAEAEPYLRKAVELVERERSNLTRDSFKTANLDLRKDCFQELVDLLVQTNRAYESLEIAERGKARAFLDMLANKRERRIASTDMGAPTEAPNLVAPSGPRPVVAMTGEAGTRSVTVTSKDGMAEGETFEETAISPVNAAPPSVDEIKSLVANRHSTCIEYLVAGGKIYTWVVHPDGSINLAPPVPVPQGLNSRVRELLTDMTKSAKTPADIAVLGAKRQVELRAMYDLLIKPIEQYLPKNSQDVVTIVPHDVLFCIPFAALLNNGGDYLIEKHTLSYAPAIGVLRATQKLREQADLLPHKLLAFGNPITERIAFLGKLPYAEKEVKHIASLYPPASTQIEIGEAATKAKFAELAPTASEIHLATHGLVDEEHPMKSAVVLAPQGQDDGLLSVRDILTLKNLKARIVVLSACQTGRGKITGDGVVGLSRAFIIAGAPSVLVSQWNVDDIMTDFQMEHFYRFYLKGSDRAKSLRDAQIATIRYMENVPDNQIAVAHKPGEIRANPRYWAAFQLIGEI